MGRGRVERGGWGGRRDGANLGGSKEEDRGKIKMEERTQTKSKRIFIYKDRRR